MRLRHITGSEGSIKLSPIYINHEQYNTLHPIESNNTFNNTFPLYLELGMGKGKFLLENAITNPNINYIGIEKYATVVLYALKNYDKYSTLHNINNVKMMCVDIKDIKSYFKEKSIDKIFLNFSDPWPKKRHENRRLTSKHFLDIYKYLLKDNATIELKTDNISLFDYSIESLNNNNYKILYKTHDLYQDINGSKDNIQTEYEEKFANKGQKICKLITTT